MTGPNTIDSCVSRPHSVQQSHQSPAAQLKTPGSPHKPRATDAYALRHPQDQGVSTPALSPDERRPSMSGRPSPNSPALRSPAMGRPMELSPDEDRSVRSRLQDLEIDEERFLAKPRVLADMFEEAKHVAQGAQRPGNGQGLLPSPEIHNKK